MSLLPPRIPRRSAVLWLPCLVLFISGCVSFASPSWDVPPGRRGALLEATLLTLDEQIPDLPLTAEERASFRARARATRSFAEEREIVRAMFDRIPASHIALFSSYAKDYFEKELRGIEAPTLGFMLAERNEIFFVSRVLRGTPAEEAGVRRGDRLLAIDGLPVARSDRLDPRHDDAAPPAERSHLLRVEAGESVAVLLERGGPGAPTQFGLELPVVVSSSLESDRRGVRIVEREGVRVGILPYAYVYSHDTSRHTLDALAGPLLEADALVLDLRGRGGSGIALIVLTGMLRESTLVRDLPVVAAIDRRSRSAKEVLARNIRTYGIGTLVGERTAGAVRPARWLELGADTWLLCPRGPIGIDERGFEGRGVEPDLRVEDPFPNGDGADPILEAAIAEAARQARTRTAEASER